MCERKTKVYLITVVYDQGSFALYASPVPHFTFAGPHTTRFVNLEGYRMLKLKFNRSVQSAEGVNWPFVHRAKRGYVSRILRLVWSWSALGLCQLRPMEVQEYCQWRDLKIKNWLIFCLNVVKIKKKISTFSLNESRDSAGGQSCGEGAPTLF